MSCNGASTDPLRVTVYADAHDLARRAAAWIADHADRRRLLALPVGRSTEMTCRSLRRHRALRGASAVTIDELYPLPRDNSRRFSARLAMQLEGSGIEVHGFDAAVPDPDAEATRVCRWVRQRGIAATVLGLGANGHVAFNEPGAALDAPSRFVPLPAETLVSLGGADAVYPARGGMTLSLDTLLTADAILLIVAGNKRAAMRRLLAEPVSPELPASVLRTHSDVHVFALADVVDQ